MPTETSTVYLDRLLENSWIDMSESFVWDEQSVTVQDVKDFLFAKKDGTKIPYGDNWQHPHGKKDKNFHISRVAYFVQHPEEITGIDVDNVCDNGYITSVTIVTDGRHRLMAAYIAGLKYVEINYSGRMDVLEYLMGIRDEEDLED